MKKTLLLGFMLLLALLSLHAQEFAIRQADDLRLESFVHKVAGNSHIIFWSDLSEGHRVIWCQLIFGTNSATIADAVRLADTLGDQELLAVSPTSDGNFVALWAEMEINQIQKYRVQKMSPSGNRLWGEEGVLVAQINEIMADACLVKNSIGGAFVVFQIYYQPVMAQNFDEYGHRLWPAEGKQLLNDSVNFFLEEVVEDTAGGLITNTQHAQGTSLINKLHRFDPSGEPIGSAPLFPPDYITNSSYKIFPPVDGEFTVYQRPYENMRYMDMLKINADGIPIWTMFSYIAIDNFSPRFKTIVPTPEGGVAIAWQRRVGETYAQHFVQKYSPNFEPMWSQPTAIFEGADDLARIDIFPSEIGNLWLCCFNTGYPRTLRGQLIDNPGNPILGAPGVLLSEAGQEAVAFSNPGLGFFLYNSLESGSKKLKLKAYNHAGTLAQNSGEINLPSRLNYNCDIRGSYTLGDRFLSLWIDHRDQSNIYFQIFDQDMNALLEPNGRAVRPTGIGCIEIFDRVITADNQLAFIYATDYYRSQRYLPQSYLQIIDAQGNLQYPENGLQLDFEKMKDIRLGSLPDGILMGWMEDTVYGVQIRAQKYVNGQAQWEDSGKLIYQVQHSESVQLTKIIGNYILWESSDYNYSSTVCKVLKVKDNGEVETGWNPSGVRLLADNDFPYENFDHMGKVGDDLIVFVALSDLEHDNIRAQKLSSNAQRLWGDSGAIISGNDDWKYIHSVVFGEDSYFLTSVSGSSIFLNKLDSQGTVSQTAQIVSETHNCYDASLVRFANGSMLCAYSDNDGEWIQNRDLYIRHINPSGIPQEGEPITLCSARYKQNYPKMAVFGNKAFISWQDDRAGIIDNEEAWTGIWGNSVQSVFTDVSDPSISPALYPKITANYPNPFNPSTRICFELPAPAQVKLSVYNLKGQLVKTLITGNTFSAGSHSVIWDGTDNRGKPLGSGVYLGRLSSGNKSDTIKMVMVK